MVAASGAPHGEGTGSARSSELAKDAVVGELEPGVPDALARMAPDWRWRRWAGGTCWCSPRGPVTDQAVSNRLAQGAAAPRRGRFAQLSRPPPDLVLV